jgi:hypothetical protein
MATLTVPSYVTDEMSDAADTVAQEIKAVIAAELLRRLTRATERRVAASNNMDVLPAAMAAEDRARRTYVYHTTGVDIDAIPWEQS